MNDPIREATEREPDRLFDHLRRFIDGIEERPVPADQFYSIAGKIGGGEIKLRYRVLRDSIREFRKYALATSARGVATFQEVYEWVVCNDFEWPYSFANLCEVFGINVEAARAALLHWRTTAQEHAARKAQEADEGSKPDGGGSLLPQGGADEAQERAEEGCPECATGIPH
jgi:hypothetical protein